ncbi:MAG: glycogen debranching enzyme N-terminal domain-containing protein [Planctomycetota bacterium]|nr:glycogen debranching enzyme N-terminal domain-containing protein [Planctomycetota bacterium]
MRDSLLSFDRGTCRNGDAAHEREWLETNGLGAYGMGTVSTRPSRRYHGWLVTPVPGREPRHLLLAGFDETIAGDGLGFDTLDRFALVPFPSHAFRVGGVEVVREIGLLPGRPVCLVRYRLMAGGAAVELSVRPRLPFREAHALTFENPDLDPAVVSFEGGISVRPYASLPSLHLSVGSDAWEFETDPDWRRGIVYATDLARGYDGHEDHFSPGAFRLSLRPGGGVVLAAAVGEPAPEPERLWQEESERRRRMTAVGETVRERLRHSARHFLFTTPRGRRSVLAGFPWFGEWGRDTFIALPGLTLARDTDRGLAACGVVLEGALAFLDGGMLPNIYGPTSEESQYGSADAVLWFARAVRLYECAGASKQRILDLFRPALAEVASVYRDGSSARAAALGIRVDEQGLLHAGRSDLNPTWMDAQTAAGPVTPRHGAAVEINALWYALLAHLESLDREAGEGARADGWAELRHRLGASFLRRFWLDDRRYLADVWRPDEVDDAVRPNMVIAAALEHSPLDREQRAAVVRRAEADLLTPRGLRTLAPDHPDYVGRYGGGTKERDAAYHQGTVWPWLLGFYVEASLRAFPRDAEIVARLRTVLDGFADHLAEHGLLHVSEVFDGDPPHRPGGTFAQAWSTAELLRAYSLLATRELA